MSIKTVLASGWALFEKTFDKYPKKTIIGILIIVVALLIWTGCWSNCS